MASRSPSPGPNTPTDVSGNKAKRFMNGWTQEQEKLMAEWADIAACYRWLHDRAEKKYSGSNMRLTIPVIILSTLTGTANFAIGSFIPPEDKALQSYVQAAIGGISIFAGILTTLGNFLRYAQGSEAHRVAGIAWGKFQRLIAVELAIHPNDRIDAMDFLKICRQDLDRLIEQSPPIPDIIIGEFEREFKDIKDLKKPDICHGIEHTRAFDASKTRLARLTADAALNLKIRKRALREDILPDVDNRIASLLEEKLKKLQPPPASQSGSPSSQPTEVMKRLQMNEIVASDWRSLLQNRRQTITTESAGNLDEAPASPKDIEINIGETQQQLSQSPAPENKV
jgi:hypothetical protein